MRTSVPPISPEMNRAAPGSPPRDKPQVREKSLLKDITSLPNKSNADVRRYQIPSPPGTRLTCTHTDYLTGKSNLPNFWEQRCLFPAHFLASLRCIASELQNSLLDPCDGSFSKRHWMFPCLLRGIRGGNGEKES